MVFGAYAWMDGIYMIRGIRSERAAGRGYRIVYLMRIFAGTYILYVLKNACGFGNVSLTYEELEFIFNGHVMERAM